MENSPKKNVNQKSKEHLNILIQFEQIILSLVNENIEKSAQSMINLFNNKYQYSYKNIICRLIYSSFVSRLKDFNIYFDFMKLIEQKCKSSDENKIINLFIKYILKKNSQESYYLLAQIAESNLIDPEIIKNKSLHFAHYNKKFFILEFFEFYNDFMDNLEKLKKDNWKFHKQLLKEGVNPNEIAKIIRNDEIEKFQEISSQPKFEFNQTIKPSLYERSSFINNDIVTLIDYAAFFGSIKCFKYLLLNDVDVENAGKYAIAGGNLEIIHLCEQNHSSFEDAYETAIKYHRNDIFKYLYEDLCLKCDDLIDLAEKCILYDSYKILSYLEEKELKINSSIIYSLVGNGNLMLTKHYIKTNQFPENIVISAVKSRNIDLVKYFIDKKVLILMHVIFFSYVFCLIREFYEIFLIISNTTYYCY